MQKYSPILPFFINMKFKFKGTPVEINVDGDVICDDAVAKNVLAPLVQHAEGNPEDGYPAINAIIDVFGKDSVTDLEYDDDSGMVY
jgi:hypothetical protein